MSREGRVTLDEFSLDGASKPAPATGVSRPICVVVLGTRPEAIKLIPVLRELRSRSLIRTIVVNTGQHRDMVRPVFDSAGIEIDFDLCCGEAGITLARLTQRIITGVDDVITDLRGGTERRTRPRLFSAGVGATPHDYPALMLVHGDTTTAFAAATVAMSNQLPVVHIEAGLRSGDRRQPFPEEFNRHLVAQIAALHFAPTSLSAQALVREGVDLRTIFVSGNTSVDAVLWATRNHLSYDNPSLSRVEQHQGPVIVGTAHRRENWGRGIQGIAEGLRMIAIERPDCLVVFSMHPNPMVRAQVLDVLAGLDNVLLVDHLDYLDFARLLDRADLAISDSGGIQEEAPSLGTPMLVTRAVSERTEGIDSGSLVLVGTDPNVIASTALELLTDNVLYEEMRRRANPFGDGNAAHRIAGALENLIFGTELPSQFSSGFDRVTTLRNAGFSLSEVRAGIGSVPQTQPQPVVSLRKQVK